MLEENTKLEVADWSQSEIGYTTFSEEITKLREQLNIACRLATQAPQYKGQTAKDVLSKVQAIWQVDREVAAMKKCN